MKRQFIHNRRMMARTGGCLTAVPGGGSSLGVSYIVFELAGWISR